MGRKLKIGIIGYPLIGGSGILASSLAMELAQRDHDIHFFSYEKPFRLNLDDSRIRFHKVPVANYRPFEYAEYTLPLAVKIAEVAASEKLDIIHAHYAVPHATASCIAREMIGGSQPKIITTLHGTDTTLLGQNRNYKFAIQHALNQSDAVTTVSESLRQDTIKTFDIENRIRVVHNFFTPSRPTRTQEEIRKQLDIGDDFVLLHMSNLRPVKRVDLLLKTLASCQRKERLKLVVLAGSPFDEFQSLAKDLGIQSNLRVVDNEYLVENYLQTADAGLYTSERESFCLSILETMFFGKPSIAFSIGGIPEVVRNTETGFLHSFEDIESMAKSIDQLVDDRELAAKMGGRAKEHACENFSADLIVPQYLDTYLSALDEGNQ